jgi:hypothetical protein
MKQFLILGAILLSSISTAQAIECASELPAVRSGHWSYRLIDGRKCWYEGKAMLPKSSLRWADKSPPAVQAESPPADQVKVPATDGRDFSDPEDGSCCWPRRDDEDNFESRWRSLGLKPAS